MIALAIATWASGAGCNRRGVTEVVPTIIEVDRFPHERHAQVACTDCHDAAAIAAGVVQIPGTRDHAPCDQGQCHQAEFQAAPGPLCRVCHVSVDATGATTPEMVPYPRTQGWRVMPARFGHQAHLDLDLVERAVGFHVGCVDCHADGDGDAPAIGGHAECARCHAREVGLDGAPAMDDCTGCHDAGGREERHRRRLITGDLHFDHRDHQRDAAGDNVRCTACHGATATSKGHADHPAPTVAACVTCHDDSARVPASMRMRTCQTCHGEITESLGALAPRDHLPATERPVDHTLAFRRDHGEDASRDTTRCAGCHTQMSGNARSACDECHQVLRPFDHNVLFREEDHGTAASTDPQRCATCHVVDYCVACHQQPPRSHAVDWLHDHGVRASLNPRACLVCHGPGGGTTCDSSGCHDDGRSP